jgi:hypothetical protein
LLYLRATEDRVVGAFCSELFRSSQPRTVSVDLRGPHLLLQSQPRRAWQHIAAL